MKAIGLISGGLDSTLTVKLLLDMGFEIICLNMKTSFCLCDQKGSCNSQKVAEKYKLPLVRIFGGKDYIDLIKNPKHGYGRGMNPCIDCRIYLFSKAKELMEKEKAEFIFTGEVLGQRPMSQRIDAMRVIDKESGLLGRVLRPLSAKVLEPTIMEKQKIIDREKLLSIRGRSRKPQMVLAKELEIGDYPCPAGGCLLTDAQFAQKLKDAFKFGEDDLRDIELLKLGRHFRLASGAKIICGRDKRENDAILILAKKEELKFTVDKIKSAYVLLLGKPTPENRLIAGQICARYSQSKDQSKLAIRCWTDSTDVFETIEAEPISDEELARLRV
jgi:tRNA U34 2-thiouridine synthase MnmA/TrmU